MAVASSAKMVGSSDGGSFVLGHQYKSATDSDGVLVKYNKEGIKLWERVWGGDGHDRFDGIATTYDGGCVVVGSFASATVGAIDSGVPLSNNGSSDAVMVKYNANGLVEWQTSWGDEYWGYAKDVALLSEGYVVLGERLGEKRIVMVKI